MVSRAKARSPQTLRTSRACPAACSLLLYCKRLWRGLQPAKAFSTACRDCGLYPLFRSGRGPRNAGRRGRARSLLAVSSAFWVLAIRIPHSFVGRPQHERTGRLAGRAGVGRAALGAGGGDGRRRTRGRLRVDRLSAVRRRERRSRLFPGPARRRKTLLHPFPASLAGVLRRAARHLRRRA